jgi:hypothetical protein
MTRLFPTVLILMPVAFVLTACGSKPTPQSTAIREASDQPIVAQQPDNSRQGGKPIPPLQLAVPSAMPAQLDGKDLKIMEEDELLGRANQAMRKEDYSRAATFQYWYVQKSKTGQYNLACFLAQVGQADAAFYWLQLAPIEEGVDTQHAERDEDLTLLRTNRKITSRHQETEGGPGRPVGCSSHPKCLNSDAFTCCSRNPGSYFPVDP